MSEIKEYINSRIASKTSDVCGEITTTATVTLDTGEVLEGQSVRDIHGYDAEEAENAASEDAISSLIPGITLVLSKK